MKILVIGSGGREHTLVWKIKQSADVEKVFCIPGNAGIAKEAECVSIKINDFEALVNFVKENNVGLTVVGPEVPLADGIVDFFNERNLRIFGPSKKASQLESSKVFSKELMRKYNIPTAGYGIFKNSQEALGYLDGQDQSKKIVVKANGLAAGKGAIVCQNISEAKAAIKQMMDDKVFGDAGSEVVVEEFLTGQEASMQIFLDGKNYSIMVPAQDHKRAFDNDHGLNTGGMGAYAPTPVVTGEVRNNVENKIIKPMINALQSENIDYRGVLYIGLMINNNEPYVIEFNCRFGDPETQVVLPLLKTDIVNVMLAVIDQKLDQINIEWHDKAAVCVVLASGGYPGSYEKGKVISGLDNAESINDITVFHAGTSAQNGHFITSGGRVLGITGTGKGIKEAIFKTYSAIKSINFEKMHYRKDIGAKALK